MRPKKVKTGDFNNDGWLDLVIGNIDSATLSIYLGSANGFIPANSATIWLNDSPYSFALQDFNQDGNIDLLTINSPSVSLFTGDGQGGFSNSLNISDRYNE